MKKFFFVIFLIGIASGCSKNHAGLFKFPAKCNNKRDCHPKGTCFHGKCFPGECMQRSDCKKGKVCFYKLRRCVSGYDNTDAYKLILKSKKGELPIYEPPTTKKFALEKDSVYEPQRSFIIAGKQPRKKVLATKHSNQRSTTRSIRDKKGQKNTKIRTPSIELAIGMRFTATTSNRECSMPSSLLGNNFEASLLWKLEKLKLGFIIGLALTELIVCKPKEKLFRKVREVYFVPISSGFILKFPLLKGSFNISLVGKTSFDLGFRFYITQSLPIRLKPPPIQLFIRTYLGFEFFLKDPPVKLGCYVGAIIIPAPFLIGLGISSLLIFFL